MDPATALAVGEKEAQDCEVEECSIKMSGCNKVLGWIHKLLSLSSFSNMKSLIYALLLSPKSFDMWVPFLLTTDWNQWCENLANVIWISKFKSRVNKWVIIQGVVPFFSASLYAPKDCRTDRMPIIVNGTSTCWHWLPRLKESKDTQRRYMEELRHFQLCKCTLMCNSGQPIVLFYSLREWKHWGQPEFRNRPSMTINLASTGFIFVLFKQHISKLGAPLYAS